MSDIVVCGDTHEVLRLREYLLSRVDRVLPRYITVLCVASKGSALSVSAMTFLPRGITYPKVGPFRNAEA